MGGAVYHVIQQQIKNRVRRSAGSDQNVTEEKVAMVFQSVLHVGRELELIVKVRHCIPHVSITYTLYAGSFTPCRSCCAWGTTFVR